MQTNRRKSFTLHLALALLWAALLLLSYFAIPILCGQWAQCHHWTVFTPIDQLLPENSYHGHIIRVWSNYTQYFAGILAVMSLTAMDAFPLESLSSSIKTLLRHTLTLFRAAAINGVFLELTRLLLRRPRPYVSPDYFINSETAWSTQFSSFFSGHTSFAFLASGVLILGVLKKHPKFYFFSQQPNPYFILALISLINAIMTGILRVLGGQHYLSDVLAASVFGMIAAYFGEYIYNKWITHKTQKPLQSS